ncbi:Codeinone reductase (NADPH) [Bertholletia excelsa]
MALGAIPRLSLRSGGLSIPIISLGTACFPYVAPEIIKRAVLEAIELGYRHFDSAAVYQTEQPLGEAIAEALSLGLIKSRDELFITSKLWCTDAHGDRVLPALRKTLENLKLDYLDLYLVHWPVSLKQGSLQLPIPKEDALPMDLNSVWSAMEECQRLGLARSIGVSNFSCKKMSEILATSQIPPAVNEVEVNPLWQQKKMIALCKANGVIVTAYSPLGGVGYPWGSNRVIECEALKEIAKAKGKTVAQVCLRWGYEQGIAMVVKSFNKERMKENLGIFDWELSDEDSKKIEGIPQSRTCLGKEFFSENEALKSVEELWDGEL